MNSTVKNVLAVLGGFVGGSAVNMGIIMISGCVIPPPDGADVTTMEGLVASMPLFEPKHFIMPFLAHGLGTLVGAFLAFKIAASHNMKFAMAIGAFFLLGGSVNAYLLPSPMWFIALDLLVAYFPMAWIGGKLAERIG